MIWRSLRAGGWIHAMEFDHESTNSWTMIVPSIHRQSFHPSRSLLGVFSFLCMAELYVRRGATFGRAGNA